MELKSRVENLFVDELKGIIEKLDAESAAEVLRGEDISALMAKFESVLAQKREAVVRDEELLEDMQSTLGMVREASIQRTMQSAIDDKEALCTIERELIGKMELCLGQLATELAESGGRGAKMAEVRSNLPAVDDPTAVRGYSWADIEALNSVLSESAASARDREAAVESIKADFAAAMDRRRCVCPVEPPPWSRAVPFLFLRVRCTAVFFLLPHVCAIFASPPPALHRHQARSAGRRAASQHAAYRAPPLCRRRGLALGRSLPRRALSRRGQVGLAGRRLAAERRRAGLGARSGGGGPRRRRGQDHYGHFWHPGGRAGLVWDKKGSLVRIQGRRGRGGRRQGRLTGLGQRSGGDRVGEYSWRCGGG